MKVNKHAGFRPFTLEIESEEEALTLYYCLMILDGEQEHKRAKKMSDDARIDAARFVSRRTELFDAVSDCVS